jgi:hypothetical protein
MPEPRPRASREEVEQAIREIREYHAVGRRSLDLVPEKGGHGRGEIPAQAADLGWNETKLRKARQFAHPETGYSPEDLAQLFRQLRQHRPVFGTAMIGLLVTVPKKRARAELQRRAIEGNWSVAELAAELKRRYGSRRQAGRRRSVPTDPDRLLVQIEEMADSWQRWYAAVSGSDRVDTPAPLDGLPATVKKQVRAVQEAVDQLHRAVGRTLEAHRTGSR